MTDGAKATLRVELTHEELKTAVQEYVVRRYPQALMNGRVALMNGRVAFYVPDGDPDADLEVAEVRAEFAGHFRIPKGAHP